MNVYVITKTYFTGADQYSHIAEVCATQEIADKVASQILSKDLIICVNCHVSKHELIGY